MLSLLLLLSCSSSWSPSPSLSIGREGHRAVVLNDGRVMVTGGVGEFDDTLVQVELWTPGASEWLPGPPLRQGSAYHSLTLLPDGRVLLLGGEVGQTPLKSVWLYTPEANLWTERADMMRTRSHHSATLLPDGRVMVFGGSTDRLGPGPEIYDVSDDTWTPVPTDALSRTHHQALWTDDALLISGGLVEGEDKAIGAATSSLSLSEGGALLQADMLRSRSYHGAAPTVDGGALAIGGSGDVSISENWALSSVEMWDGQAWGAYGELPMKTVNPSIVSLGGAGVMVIGGSPGAENQSLNAVAIIDTDQGLISESEPLLEGRRAHASVQLLDGRVMVIGGNVGRWPTDSTELFSPKSVYR